MGAIHITACFAEHFRPSETMETGPSNCRILAGPSDQVEAEEAVMRSFSLLELGSARAVETQAAKMGRAIRIQPRPVLVQCTDRLLPDAANAGGQRGGPHYRNGARSVKEPRTFCNRCPRRYNRRLMWSGAGCFQE
jgi:hypothetical protein